MDTINNILLVNIPHAQCPERDNPLDWEFFNNIHKWSHIGRRRILKRNIADKISKVIYRITFCSC